jgi:hypothetical protein
MTRKFFAHKCPTINAGAKVNHFAHPEISRLGGFSAESNVMPDPESRFSPDCGIGIFASQSGTGSESGTGTNGNGRRNGGTGSGERGQTFISILSSKIVVI